MSEAFKNRTLSFFVIPFLIYSLIGQGILSGLVVCIGENKDVGIELNNHCSETIPSNCVLDASRTCNVCLDIPISISSKDPNISSIQYSHVIKNMIDSASSAPSVFQGEILTGASCPQRPSLLTSTLTSLQTIVLLI